MSAINKPMDPKTKQLVEEAEARAKKVSGPWKNTSFASIDSEVRTPSSYTKGNPDEFGHTISIDDDSDRSIAEFIAHSWEDIHALCSAVREQDKRARHAEAERDTFDKRITELEIERDGLNLETEAKAKMIADLVAKLEAIPSNGNVVPTNENFVRVAMVKHHGKSEMRPEYVQEWARRFGPALDIIRARVASKVNELEAKLVDAIELAAEAIPYASDYFREKYEFESRLAKLSGTNTSLLPKQTPPTR